MDRSDIENRIRIIICDELGIEPGEVTANANLELDLGADSLDAAEILFAIEEEFDIEIGDEEAPEIKTVGDAVKTVERYLRDAADA